VSDVLVAVRYFVDGLMTARRRVRNVAPVLSILALCLQGCVGVFASSGESVSVGTHARGALLHGVAMPFEGDGYEIHRAWRSRDHRYATTEVVAWLTRVFSQVEQAAPGSVAHLGDLSGRRGGDATMHRSHESGRDVDLFYFACDRDHRPLDALPAMLHFTADGKATRWSVARSGQPVHETVPEAYFDVRRNWMLVRALLSSPGVRVQWIFAHRALSESMLMEGQREGAPAELLERAGALLHQPTDSQPHDDHMHVRVFCDPGDRAFGCIDKGPRRWLKKHWKYLGPVRVTSGS
jgi:penicillin-insensitive murein endopeptidase